MQLMELAILNGTYRDANIKSRKDEAEAGVSAVSTLCLQPFLLVAARHTSSESEELE